MKERLVEAYKANYKATVDSKSQGFLKNLEKLEGYVDSCIEEFETKHNKGKFVKVSMQKPKISDLNAQLDKFDSAFTKMCENSREFRGDF
jgi:hypothetical protein